MKKGGTFLLIILSIGFCSFLLGLFVGRSLCGEPPVIEIVTQTVPEEKESVTHTIPTQSVQQININTASVVLLDTLPGIGPVLAERIITFREEHGPFQKTTDLAQVEGIGPEKLLSILDLITVED